MSQIQQQFDKLWKIVDDNIKTGRYKQIKCHISDDECGRCINGLFISYILGHPMFVPTTKESLLEIFQEELAPKYNYVPTYDSEKFEELIKVNDKETLLKGLKEYHNKTGQVDQVYLAQLNNNGMSFEEIRDLLKEMNV